ncbi:hypothetical protein LEMLEM_LOCUS11147, partial [Lemmus lemmus]
GEQVPDEYILGPFLFSCFCFLIAIKKTVKIHLWSIIHNLCFASNSDIFCLKILRRFPSLLRYSEYLTSWTAPSSIFS